jgi:hypothetical protein
MGAAPKWLVIRNVSDPLINGNLSTGLPTALNMQAHWAVWVYEALVLTSEQRIATWAQIAPGRGTGRHGRIERGHGVGGAEAPSEEPVSSTRRPVTTAGSMVPAVPSVRRPPVWGGLAERQPLRHAQGGCRWGRPARTPRPHRPWKRWSTRRSVAAISCTAASAGAMRIAIAGTNRLEWGFGPELDDESMGRRW